MCQRDEVVCDLDDTEESIPGDATNTCNVTVVDYNIKRN